MTSLLDREALLVSYLQVHFPGHRVRGVIGPLAAVQTLDLIQPPELHVVLQGWQPARDGIGQAGGSCMWTVRIIESELRSLDARRINLYPAAEAVREILNGVLLAPCHSPLVAAGGKLVAAGNPWAVWEESWLEHIPAAGEIRPALAPSIELLIESTAELDAGTNEISISSASMSTGDLLLVYDPASGASAFLGEVLSVGLGHAVVERGLQEAFPAGSQVYRMENAFRFPVTNCPGTKTNIISNAHSQIGLDGRAHRVSMAAPRIETDLRFSPVLDSHAKSLLAFIAEYRLQSEFVYGTEDGRLYLLHPREDTGVSGSGALAEIIFPAALNAFSPAALEAPVS